MEQIKNSEYAKIPFDYFYRIFIDKYRQEIVKTEKSRIGDKTNVFGLNDIIDSLLTSPLSNDEILLIYDKILYDICIDYISLSNCLIDVISKDIWELIGTILDKTQENPYKESFLFSLQFICQNYFERLEKGCPMLVSSTNSSSLPTLQVTLDSRYKITDLEAINMDLLEQTQIITKMLSMEINHENGPIPKVMYRIRQDI